MPNLKFIPSWLNYTSNSSCINLLCYKESVGVKGVHFRLERFAKFSRFHNLWTFLNIFTKSLFHKTEILSYLISVFLPYYMCKNLRNLLKTFLKKENGLHNFAAQLEKYVQEYKNNMIFKRFLISFSVKLWRRRMIIWNELFNFIQTC